MNLIARMILLSSVCLILTALPGNAAVLTVTKTADTNDVVCNADCSLREAIFAAAASGDEIQFASPLFDSPQVITLSDTFRTLRIGKSLTITGKGAHLLTIRRSPSATVNFLIVDIDLTGPVSLSGLTITGGSGVSVEGAGAVTLTNIVITGNTAVPGFAAGISSGGQTINLINSTVSNNTSNIGGGQTAAAIRNHNSTLNIINSTISGNSLTGGGNANGGAIRNSGSAPVNITNSTITNNSTDGLSNTNAGGIGNFSGTVTIRNSIIAGNNGTVPDVYGDIDGTYLSSGYNLIGNNTGATTFFPVGNPNASHDIVGTSASPIDPRLDPLGLNSGTTPTHRLQTAPVVSPAIDKGSDLGGLTADQRGLMRPFDNPAIANAGGANANGSDIGAFEVQPIVAPAPNAVQFSSSNYTVVEACTTVTITINRIGDTSGAATVDYATSDATGSERRDYITAIGKLSFAPSETSKTFSVLINDDSNVEGTETFNITLSNPSGSGLGEPSVAAVQIIDNPTEPGTNVIDDAANFVCQQYHDFLNRQPDASGQAFWTNEITSCGSNQACIELKRINVSAAFYLSIEFQGTGYLVERIYKAAYGNANGTSTFGGSHTLPVPIVRLNEFLQDTQQMGSGVVVGQAGWELVLEANKQAFTAEFVQRSRFATAFPTMMTPAQFVDALFANAAVTPSATDRQAAIDEFGGAGTSADLAARGRLLRRVAENATFTQQEFNRAFVLMQYFGYLRRNPNDPQDSDYTGYDFWLTKLTDFNGNFIDAEMVKAFITSGEYRQRFGP